MSTYSSKNTNDKNIDTNTNRNKSIYNNESTFNMNLNQNFIKLLKEEQLTNKKTKRLTSIKKKAKAFKEEELELDLHDWTSTESFYGQVGYFTMNKEIRGGRNIFNKGLKNRNKEGNCNSNSNSNRNGERGDYFGAFVNNKVAGGSNMRCGIPNLMKNSNIYNSDNEEKQFQSELGKYLNNFQEKKEEEEEVDEEKINLNSNENFESVDKKLLILKNIEILQKLISENQNFFQTIKTVPQKIIEQNLPSKCRNNIMEETLLLNPFKVINYDISLQKTFSNIIYRISSPADLLEFFPYLIYLVQGIPSKLFSFNPNALSFELTDINFRFMTCLHRLSKNFLEYFIDFGNKMHLISVINEYFLYKNETTPYVFKKFYSQINLIFIKVNESIISKKGELLSNKINLIGLFNKLEKLLNVVNLVFHMLNLPETLEKFAVSLENNLNIANVNVFSNNNYYNENNLNKFLLYYEDSNLNLKSHKLINSLFNFFSAFNQAKTRSYVVVKNILLNILKSYLQFIIYLIFNNELIDQSNEYFMKAVKSGGNNSSTCTFSIDSSKVPLFLSDYKNILINNTILLSYIKAFDSSYFSVCNYKLSEVLSFTEKFTFTSDPSLNSIYNFKELKDKIFNRKCELMFTYNENTLNENELRKNEEQGKRLNYIRTLKDFMSLKDVYNKEQREKEIERKRRSLEEIQSQINKRKQMIEEDIKRIKEEKIEEIRRDKQGEEMKQEIMIRLREKYLRVNQHTKDMQFFGTGKDVEIWKMKRKENKVRRYDLFESMFDVEKIENVYSEKIGKIGKIAKRNYHYGNLYNNLLNENYTNLNLNMNVNMNVNMNTNMNVNVNVNHSISAISLDHFNNNINKNISTIENIIIPEIEHNLSTININTDNLNKNKNRLSELVSSYPKFFIKNIILNEVLNPIIDTAIEFAVAGAGAIFINTNNIHTHTHTHTNNKDKEKRITSKVNNTGNRFQFFKTNSNDEVDLEVSEILNKMQVLIAESQSQPNIKTNKSLMLNADNDNLTNANANANTNKIEIPIQVIIQEFFYDLIIKQYKIVNNCFTLMIKSKYNLKSHLELLRNVYLCQSGEIIHSFIESCVDFKTLSLISNEEEYLSDLLISELNKKYSTPGNDFISFIKNFKFTKVNNLSLRYSITNLEMAFKLNYKLPEPINFIFNSKIIDKYDIIFKYFLKFIIFQNIMSKIFSVLKNQKRNNNKNSNLLFYKISKTFHKTFNLLKSVQHFLLSEILDKKRIELNNIIEESINIFTVMESHSEFLDKIIEVLNNKILLLVNKLHMRFAKFYLRNITTVMDYFDCEPSEDLAKLVGKIERDNERLSKVIAEEQIIGEFHDLKYYLS